MEGTRTKRFFCSSILLLCSFNLSFPYSSTLLLFYSSILLLSFTLRCRSYIGSLVVGPYRWFIWRQPASLAASVLELWRRTVVCGRGCESNRIAFCFKIRALLFGTYAGRGNDIHETIISTLRVAAFTRHLFFELS